MTDIAKVLHKEDQAKTVEKDYDDLVKTTKQEFSGKSMGSWWLFSGSPTIPLLWLLTIVPAVSSSIRTRILCTATLFLRYSKTATADWSAVSLEKLAELDADYLILVNSDQGADFF